MTSSSDDMQCLREELEAKTRAAALAKADASNKGRQLKRLMNAKEAAETRIEELEAELAAAATSSGSPASKALEDRIQELDGEVAASIARCGCLEATNKSLKETVKQYEAQIELLKYESKAASPKRKDVSKGADARIVIIEQLEAQRSAADARAERQDAVIKRLEARLLDRDTKIGELKGELTVAASSSLQQVSKANDVRIEQLEAERDAAKSRAERLDAVIRRMEVRMLERDGRIQELKDQLSDNASVKQADVAATQLAEETLKQCRADLESARDAEAVARSNYQAELNSESRVVAEYCEKLTAEARNFATVEARMAEDSEARKHCEERFANAPEQLHTHAKDAAQVKKYTSLEAENHEIWLEPMAPGTGGSFLDECCPDDDSALLRGQLEKLHMEVRTLNDELVDARKKEIAKDLQVTAAEASAQTEENELRRLKELHTKMLETKEDFRLDCCAQPAGRSALRSIASPNRVGASTSVDPVPAELGGLTAPRHTTVNLAAASPGKSPGNKRSPMLAAEAEEHPSTPIKFTRQMMRVPSTPSTLSKVEEFPLTPVAKQLQERDSDIENLRSELRCMTMQLSSAQQETSAKSLAAQIQNSEDADNLRSELHIMTMRLSSAQEELSAKSSVSEMLVARIKKSEGDSRLKERMGEVEAQATLAKERVGEVEVQAALAKERYVEERSEHEHERRTLRSEVVSIGDQLSEAQQKLSERVSRFERLETEVQAQKTDNARARGHHDCELQSLRLEVSNVTSQLSSAQMEKKALYQELWDSTSRVEKLEIQSQVQKSEVTKAQNVPLLEIHHLRSELGCRTSQLELLQKEILQKTSVIENLQVQAEIQKSEIANAQSQVLLKDRLTNEFQEHGREAEAKALSAKDALGRQLQTRNEEIERLRSEAYGLKTCLSSAQQEISEKTSIVEDLEVQAQIHESEIGDAQGQIEVKNKLIKHLQREVLSQKELISIMKDAEQVYSQLCSVSENATTYN